MPRQKIELVLTFDDVLLVPHYSDVLPQQASLSVRLAANLALNLPFVSAAMDTVTWAPMAYAMAANGGLGIIHKNASIEAQAAAVAQVKGAPCPEIPTAAASVNTQAAPASALAATQPPQGCLEAAPAEPAAAAPLAGSQAPHLAPVTVAPGTAAPVGAGATGPATDAPAIAMAIGFQPALDRRGRLLVGAAIGVGSDRDRRAQALVQAGVDVLVVDTAHGHTAEVLAAVRDLRRAYPQLPIVAGNVVTAEGTYALLEAGADTVKVGIGPGSICTTRLVAGVGVPQLSAVLACAEAARSRGASIIADGGLRQSGDIVKALAAGATAVMMGGMLAGTDEAADPGGDKLGIPAQSDAVPAGMKVYRGMGSRAAMVAGSADRYGQADLAPQRRVAEGVSAHVRRQGPLSGVLQQLGRSVALGMRYLGAKDLGTLYENAHFVRVSAAGMRESAVHDVYAVCP